MLTQQQIDEFLKNNPGKTIDDITNYARKKGVTSNLPTDLQGSTPWSGTGTNAAGETTYNFSPINKNVGTNTGTGTTTNSGRTYLGADGNTYSEDTGELVSKGTGTSTNTGTGTIGSDIGKGVANSLFAGIGGFGTGTNTGTPVEGSASSVFGVNYGDTSEFDANQAYLNTLNEGPVTYEDTYKSLLEQNQQRVDATKAYYNDLMNQARVQGEGRLGSNRAVQARSGLLGSSFGSAQTGNIETANLDVQKGITNQMNVAIQGIYSQLSSDAMQLAKDKTEAKMQGAEALLKHYTVTVPASKERAADYMASQLVDQYIKNPGIDMNSVIDGLDEKRLAESGITKDDVRYRYNILKKQQDADIAAQEAQATKDKQEADKNAADIAYKEAQTILEMVKAGELQEVGGRIYRPTQDENGNITREFVADARAVTNALAGSGTGGTGGTSSGYSSGSGMRTDRHNNPIAVAVTANGTNQFTQALNNAGIQWSYGDAFADNPSMVTIKYGSTQDGIEGARAILANTNAIQGWYLKSTGKNILSQYGISDNKQFASLDKAKQDEIIKGIYKAEGGNGSIFGEAGGGAAGLSDLAQSVLKGIITIQQIPSAQRAKVAEELARAGTETPKTREIENTIDLIDTMLLDENALKSISGWWGGRIPGTGIFGNQLAINQFNQLKGILSLGEREKLKGSGAISDYESKLLSQASSALGRNLSEEDFKAEIEKIRDILSGKYKYITEDMNQVQNNTTDGQGSGGVVNGAI